APRRGGGRPLHRSRGPPDDLLGLGAGVEPAAARRGAGAALPLTLAIHPGALGDVLLAIPALRVLRRASPPDPLELAAQARISRLLETLGVVGRAVDFESLGLDALFAAAPGGGPSEWPARCAEELRRATRVIAWIGSREPAFVDRLTTLVPGSIVA